LATYTITYNAGTNVTDVTVPANQIKTHDVLLTLSPTKPTRTNYTFVGWNTTADGGGTSYAAGASYTINANITLYAQWRQTVIINGPSVNYGGETYQTVVIGSQTWFKRNLNYEVESSKCYGEDGEVLDRKTDVFITLSNSEIQANCAKYGRLYDWVTAMNLPPDCGWGTGTSCASQISAKHMGICPSGWHIPSNDDWDKLMRYVDGASGTGLYNSHTAGTKLKSSELWNSYSGVTKADEYGFSALPGGSGRSDGLFYGVGDGSSWWSATENGSDFAYGRHMYYFNNYVAYGNDGIKGIYLYSVRCLQD